MYLANFLSQNSPIDFTDEPNFKATITATNFDVRVDVTWTGAGPLSWGAQTNRQFAFSQRTGKLSELPRHLVLAPHSAQPLARLGQQRRGIWRVPEILLYFPVPPISVCTWAPASNVVWGRVQHRLRWQRPR
jgi:hypothetical protein